VIAKGGDIGVSATVSATTTGNVPTDRIYDLHSAINTITFDKAFGLDSAGLGADRCDLTEKCIGVGGQACPLDAKKPNGTHCTDDGNACTTDTCNGTSNTCQHAGTCHVITGGATAGSTHVSGQAAPNITAPNLKICAVGPNGKPDDCAGDDAQLGSGGTTAAGSFDISRLRPLQLGEKIFAFDAQNQRQGPVITVVAAATAAPAVGPAGLLALLVSLLLLGSLRLGRPSWPSLRIRH
jgi:hypothetical protein